MKFAFLLVFNFLWLVEEDNHYEASLSLFVGKNNCPLSSVTCIAHLALLNCNVAHTNYTQWWFPMPDANGFPLVCVVCIWYSWLFPSVFSPLICCLFFFWICCPEKMQLAFLLCVAYVSWSWLFPVVSLPQDQIIDFSPFVRRYWLVTLSNSSHTRTCFLSLLIDSF